MHASVVESVGPIDGVSLKWPNDLLVSNAKLAGILLERHSNVVVIGIGVNLAFAPAIECRTTQSLAALGKPTERNYFAENLAQQMRHFVTQWRETGLSTILRYWLDNAHQPGAELSIPNGEERISGHYAGLDEQGALLLVLSDGSVKTIYAGDVHLV